MDEVVIIDRHQKKRVGVIFFENSFDRNIFLDKNQDNNRFRYISLEKYQKLANRLMKVS